MKKFLISLIVATVTVLCAAGAGCGGSGLPASKPDGEWFEVQTVVYYTGSNYNSKTSRCFTETETSIVTKEEYENAPEARKNKLPFGYYFESYGKDIPVNRKEFIKSLNDDLNVDYYTPGYAENTYLKHTLKSYELQYVNVRFSDGNVMEINHYRYYGEEENNCVTVRILPSSYAVTYFND